MTKCILVGSDPELFVFNKDGKPFSAIGLLGGSKDEPRKVEYGAVQEDNVLAEFNIDPAASEDEFVHNILAVRTTLDLLLPEGLYTKVVASVEYSEEELRSFGEQAMVFGCDPDMNPYTMGENPPPNAASTLRTAGGHIHVGYDGPNIDTNLDIVQTMDVILGIPSVMMDKDTRRRSMYGKPGAYRQKDYGVEYRPLSNFWLESEDKIRWAYRNTIRAVEEAMDGAVNFNDEHTMGVPWKEVQRILNESDRSAAERIVNALNLEVV